MQAFASAARDLLANPNLRYGTVLAASQLLSDALEQEHNLREWYPGDVTRLLLFLGRLRRVPMVRTTPAADQVAKPYVERSSWVRQRLQALMEGSLARFRAAIDDRRTGYRARLLDALSGRLVAGPVSEREWAELEHDLCYMAALLLAEDRDGPELAAAIAGCAGSAPDDASAVAALRALLTAAPSPHQVAVVLRGARSVDVASAAAFGISPVDRDRPGWSPGCPAADGQLAAFVAEWAPASDCAPLVVHVDAQDRGHARRAALLAAEALADHLVVAHPRQRFVVRPLVLVLDSGAGTASTLGAAAEPIAEARAPGDRELAELRPFLRANALARREAAPVLRVLHTWIALECLGREPDPGAGSRGEARRPALTHRLEAYLPPYLAGIAAAAGLRAQLTAGWAAVRAVGRGSERCGDWLRFDSWLGTDGGRPPSLTRLVSVLRALGRATGEPAAALPPDAPIELAAGFLRDLAAATSPFAARRLETLGRQFDKGSRLAKAAEAIQVRALIAIARLKLVRHVAVHASVDAAPASAALALSGLHLLDDAFETLQRWLRPGCPAWRALADARHWHDGNLAAWRSTADLTVDADHLLHPRRR